MSPIVNGDDVEIHHGDKIIPLNERLEGQDREIRRMKIILGGIMAVLLVHAAAPQLDLLHFVMSLIP